MRIYWDRVRNTYLDRLVMEANGASFFVNNGAFEEDMASFPTHIYNGSFYCMYSRRQYGQNCGTINGVNVPVTDSGITTLTTRGGPSQRCIPGDSGGQSGSRGTAWSPSRPA